MLSDEDVVAFELPRLSGIRQQSFHVIDRTRNAAHSRKAKPVPAETPKRLAGKLARLLDSFGAVNAVASSRTRLLFESAPILFFADIPAARLKQRPANKLRRDLVALELRACVVRAGDALATLMIWPLAEQAITAFVNAAVPDYQTNPDFERALRAPDSRPLRPAGRGAAAGGDREAKLLGQIATLQKQIETLTRAQSARGAMEQLGLDDTRLKSMLKLLHPDKHANSEAATEAAKWLNAMRDLLKG